MPCVLGSRAGGAFARGGFVLSFEGISRGKIVRDVEETRGLLIADDLRTGNAFEGDWSVPGAERREDDELAVPAGSVAGCRADDADVPLEDSVTAACDERGLLKMRLVIQPFLPPTMRAQVMLQKLSSIPKNSKQMLEN